jgi:addiction module RelE/StbE family toxin
VIELVWGTDFKRVFKKLIRQNPVLRENLFNVLKLFQNEPFHPSLKTHKLSGQLKGLFAFSLSYDWRVVFKFTGKDEALLITMGPHDKVY